MVLLGLEAFPISAQETAIDAGNAFRLQEIHRLGRGKAFTTQFTADDARIAVGGSLGVWLYDSDALNTPTEPEHLPSVSAELLAVAPDGKTYYVASSDIIQVWSEGELAYELDTKRRILDLVLSRAGDLLITSHSDDTLQMRFHPQADPIVVEASAGTVDVLAFSPDGSLLASGGDRGSLSLWHLADSIDRKVVNYDVTFQVVEYSPDDTRTATDEGGSLRIRENSDTIAVTVFASGADITALAFTPDGATLVSGNADGAIDFWDVKSAERLRAFEAIGHRRAVTTLALSPDGAQLASGGRDVDVRLWDIGRGTQISIGSGPNAQAWIQPERGFITSLQFSPDGRQLLVSASEEFVGLYDVASRQLLSSAVGHLDEVVALDFSPAGDQLAFADKDGEGEMWTMNASGEMAPVPYLMDVGGSRGNTHSLRYAPDGSFFALNAPGETWLYDPDTREIIHILDVDGVTTGLAISPDSRLVAVSSTRNISVFSVESGLLVGKLDAHNDRVLDLQFSPDQTLLASSGADGTLRIYGLDG